MALFAAGAGAGSFGPLAPSSGTLSPLPDELHRGLTAVAFFASISLVSSASLFLYFTYKLIRWRIRSSRRERLEHDAGDGAPPGVDLSLGLAQRHFGAHDERFHHQPRRRREPPNQFLILVYNLFLADTMQACAFFLNAVWVAKNGIFVHNAACFIQGWLVSNGDLSSSCFVTAIAIHTYLTIVRGYKPPQWALNTAVIGIWIFVYGITIVGLGVTRNGREAGGYYVRASAWCWINVEYENLRLLNHYLFIFIGLALTSLLYGLTFFHLQSRRRDGERLIPKLSGRSVHPSEGTTVGSTHRPATAKTSASSLDIRTAVPDLATGIPELPDLPGKPRLEQQEQQHHQYHHSRDASLHGGGGGGGAEEAQAEPDTDAASGYHPAFLLYPIIYVVCTLPLAAGRIATMAGADVPLWYFCTAGALISSNGWLDVLLWGSTRRALIFGSADDVDDQRVGLDTFAFMRTPRGRQFGNMVWVQGASRLGGGGGAQQAGAERDGGAEGAGERGCDGKWGWLGGRKGVRLSGEIGHGRSGSQESLRGSLSGYGPGRGGGDMAIHLDLVTSVVVEVDRDPTARDAAEQYRRQHGLTPQIDRSAFSGPELDTDKESSGMQFITSAMT